MTLHDSWVALEPLLRPAIARSPDKPRVLADVMAGYAQLWAVRENGKPVAAVVTRLTIRDEKRCLFWLVGGSRFMEWVGDCLTVIEAWAREQQCVALWATGRIGWTRHAAKLGWDRIDSFDGMPAWQRRL